MENKKFTFIDLFSGIGGFKMALSNNGGECIAFSEISKDAINAYCENFNVSSDKNLGNITKVKELPSHDLLTAGVPCQSWSIAGKNLGFDDDRGQLWNDTIYLLKQSQPKAFIFENVKGLVDPRNKEALSYILKRIREAGYFADYFVINSHDYGVPQNRVRIYIIGFKDKSCFDKFKLPKPSEDKIKLADILKIELSKVEPTEYPKDLFGNTVITRRMSLSSKNGRNDYFVFNDLRNDATTIHSWDIIDTTKRQKEICLLLLTNRRKKKYGKLDGNPLSLENFQSLDNSISQKELDNLVELKILKPEEYKFKVINNSQDNLEIEELEILSRTRNEVLIIDELKTDKKLKVRRIKVSNVVEQLKEKGIIKCVEVRYDFKNTKISSGLYGVSRIFLPTSDVFPTLVASDTNDFVTLETLEANTNKEYRDKFLE